MAMSDVMQPFQEVLADRHGWIENYKKETNSKIAGVFSDYVPEEVLTAAGFVTIRVTGESGNVISADKYMQSNLCSFARRAFDQAMEGKYDYLDALSVPHTCDVITKLHDLWAYRLKNPGLVNYFWMPHKVFDPNAVMVVNGEIKRLKKEIEDHFDIEISPESITDAIKLYDKSRALLKRVYDLRKTSPPKISGVDAFSVSLSSILTPRDVHIKWMEDLLKEYEGKDSDLSNKPRVMISASNMDDLALVKAVEDSGAWVVSEECSASTRYFNDLVGEFEGDPIKPLGLRYLNKLPSPRSVDSTKPRTEFILNTINDYKVNGIIFYILRCCDTHKYTLPIIKKKIEEAGIPLLYIEGDQTAGMSEPIVNRIKAFTEMISS
jgi:benzoyl-CoA reductase subunit C